MFIGRETEIEKLNRFYESDDKVAVVYGQKGIGKTTLLQEFCKDKKNIYFTAYDTCGEQMLTMFANAARVKGKVSSIEDILEEITKQAEVQKVVIVIDQYQAFAKADTSYEKILYGYVTNQWKELPIKLIFSGEAYLFFEKHIYGKKAIWKDCLGEQLQLSGMGFYDCMKFYPDALGEEAAFLYGITGGVPALLEKVSESVEKSAKAIFFEAGGYAFLPEVIMGTELRELSYYNQLLTCLASGMNRVNQISEAIQKPKDVVVPYFNTLMAMGIVTKNTAITEETNRKKTRYSIVSSNIQFWYQYVIPHMDLYFNGSWDLIWEDAILPELDAYMQQVFIRICKEYIEKQALQQKMPFTVEKIGNWWRNDDEKKTTEGFDIVALGECQGRSASIFVQCFYDEEPIEISQLKELIEKSKQVNYDGEVFFLVFSRSGFNENALTVASAIKNIMLLTFDDVCHL